MISNATDLGFHDRTKGAVPVIEVSISSKMSRKRIFSTSQSGFSKSSVGLRKDSKGMADTALQSRTAVILAHLI